MKKHFLFLTVSAAMLTACSPSQSDNDSSSSVSSSSASSSVSEESSQSSQSSETSSVEESVSSESIEEESSSEDLTWSSMDEAIDFYENTLIAEKGEELAGIELNGEFYERDMWELVQNEGDTIVLFKPNLGRGDGGQNIEFVKGEEYTTLTYFEPNTPYPEEPLSKHVVRNIDYVTIDTENISSRTWDSLDEAIDFYENTYKNTDNELSKNIDWENYDRSALELENSEGNRIVLHWTKTGGIDGTYIKLIKRNEEYTELYKYENNTSYPDSPAVQYIIQNDNFTVISTVEIG